VPVPVPGSPRVLFLTTGVPRDGETGGQIASWRVLNAYASFAQVDVLALTPPGAPVPRELTELAGQTATVPIPAFYYRQARLRLLVTLARSQLGGRPYRIAKFDRRQARQILADWAAQSSYDLLHCDHLATTPYAACVPGTPFVFADYDVESNELSSLAAAQSNPLGRAILRREAQRTRAAERMAVTRAARVFAVSEEDARLLGREDPQLSAKISTLPVPLPEAEPVPRRPDGAFTLLVLGPLQAGGRLDGLRWLLASVWPRFRAQHPEARLLVVGAGAPDDIRARDGQEGVEVRGFVEDLDGVLSESDLCAMPLLTGGGIRIKVLELLPRGVPCLGSRIAVRGFVGVEGVYEANAPEEWLENLSAVAARPEEFRRAALAGAATLRCRFSPQATAAALEQALGAALGR
jgi:glycosyltransferase involved in cell wall biosynthesis